MYCSVQSFFDGSGEKVSALHLIWHSKEKSTLYLHLWEGSTQFKNGFSSIFRIGVSTPWLDMVSCKVKARTHLADLPSADSNSRPIPVSRFQ